jgi:enolase
MQTGHLKTGVPARGDRVEKYNPFVRIEDAAGDTGQYTGRSGFAR